MATPPRFPDATARSEPPGYGWAGDRRILVRELRATAFSQANEIWRDYHGTTGDPATDRIFGVFQDGALVSVARCRRHPGGMEVDGIFTPEDRRGMGFSRLAVGALIEACHNDDLFMYAVSHLSTFYATFGFEPIPEKDLPAGVRERYTWAGGQLEGAEVRPMQRKAGIGTIFTK
jgi:predicted GNAT family N-acyltransferase